MTRRTHWKSHNSPAENSRAKASETRQRGSPTVTNFSRRSLGSSSRKPLARELLGSGSRASESMYSAAVCERDILKWGKGDAGEGCLRCDRLEERLCRAEESLPRACPSAVSDGCERQLRQGVKSSPNYRGSLFTNRNRKTHPSCRSSELGRQQAGKAAFLPDSIPTGQRSCPAAAAPGSPWFYVPLSSANRFLALRPEGMGVPSYFQQGARGLGPPPTGSPSQIHSGPMGCRKSFPAPKPAEGARGHPAVQPQAPRTGQETPNEATLRQDISCNSPDHQSLLLPPSQGTGEESDSKESSQGQGIPINRNKGWGN